MKRNLVTIALLFVLFGWAVAQKSSLQIGTQFPLMYSAGYEIQFKERMAFNIQAGILTKPYDKIILDMLKLFGTKEPIVNTIGNAYNIGYTFQPTIKYSFSKFYTGVFYSYYSLYANDTPAGAIESYYRISFLPEFKNSEMQLNSQLHNAGILIGKKIPFKNESLSMNIEFSVGKVLYSESKLTSASSGKESSASPLVNSTLKNYYRVYGFLPSLNMFLVKTF